MEIRTKSHANLPPFPHSSHIRRNRRSHAGSPSSLAAAVGKPWRTKGRGGGRDCDGPRQAGASCVGRRSLPRPQPPETTSRNFMKVQEEGNASTAKRSHLLASRKASEGAAAVAQGSHGGRRGARKFAAEARVGEKQSSVYLLRVFGLSLGILSAHSRWA